MVNIISTCFTRKTLSTTIDFPSGTFNQTTRVPVMHPLRSNMLISLIIDKWARQFVRQFVRLVTSGKFRGPRLRVLDGGSHGCAVRAHSKGIRATPLDDGRDEWRSRPATAMLLTRSDSTTNPESKYQDRLLFGSNSISFEKF